jgi:hypothetical protein
VPPEEEDVTDRDRRPPPLAHFTLHRDGTLTRNVKRGERLRYETPPPAFTCPVCGAKSWHPEDGRQGYCGRCHAHTGDPATADLVREQRAAAAAELHSWRFGTREPWLGPAIARALRWLADLFEPLEPRR